jgi:protein pelota
LISSYEVEQAQGKVVVFSTAFEPGEKLHKLGGIAALLRFKVRADPVQVC